MQQITYQNADGQEAVFGLTPPFIFEKVEGIHAADTELLTSDSPRHNGSQFHNLRLRDREITLYFHIEGKNRQEMYQKRMEALALLSASGGGTGKFVYKNDAGSWWIPAIVKQGPVADSRLQNFNHCQAIFYCPDPNWRSMTETEADLAYSGFGFELPFELDTDGVEFGNAVNQAVVTNSGTSSAPLYIRIEGPADCPKVVKTSTGEYIRLKTQLSSDQSLLIDTTHDNASVQIEDSSGKLTNGFGYLDLNSVLFQLDPGENILLYESSDDTLQTRVSVRFYHSYEGV